jgi:hypothetical protein
MRTPSRCMAAYAPRRTPWYGWLALGGIFCGAVCLLIAYPLEVLGFAAVLAPIAIICSRRRQGQMARLIESRRGGSICEFARSFDVRAVDPWIIRATFEQIRNYLSAKDSVAIRATDNLTGDLLIDPEDLDFDVAVEIAQRTGRSLENTERNPYFGRVTLVSDLVHFFNEQPKHVNRLPVVLRSRSAQLWR